MRVHGGSVIRLFRPRKPRVGAMATMVGGPGAPGEVGAAICVPADAPSASSEEGQPVASACGDTLLNSGLPPVDRRAYQVFPKLGAFLRRTAFRMPSARRDSSPQQIRPFPRYH